MQRPQPTEGHDQGSAQGQERGSRRTAVSARADGPPSDVKQALAQTFWLRERELAFEAEQPRKAEQTLGGERELRPPVREGAPHPRPSSSSRPSR